MNINSNQKDCIVNIVSASGSGKTTIAKELEKRGCNIIHSFTTRDPRKPNEWGHTFASLRDLEKHSDDGRVIAHFNKYDTKEHYWATVDQYKNKGISIYVIDPSGAKNVKEVVSDANVITIFISCDKKTREERMSLDVTRTKEDIEKRLNLDKKVFEACECDYVVDGNRSVDDVTNSIVDIIKPHI